MTIVFQKINSNEDCLICKSPTNPKTAVHHSGCYEGGILHGSCILGWGDREEKAQRVARCICDKAMDMDLLREIVPVPLKERIITELKLIKEDALIGAVIGAITLGTVRAVGVFGAIVPMAIALVVSKNLKLDGLVTVCPIGAALLGAGIVAAIGEGVEVKKLAAENVQIFGAAIAAIRGVKAMGPERLLEAIDQAMGPVTGLEAEAVIETIAEVGFAITGFIAIAMTSEAIGTAIVRAITGGAVGTIALGILTRL